MNGQMNDEKFFREIVDLILVHTFKTNQYYIS